MVRKFPFHLPLRLNPLRLGLGVDQVRQAFGFGQVHLAVLEGAARELARLGRPNSLQTAEDRQQFPDNRRAAVNLEFRDILARNRARPRQPKYQPPVDRRAGVGIAKRAQNRPASGNVPVCQVADAGAGPRPRRPDHRDTRLPGA